MMSLAHTLFYCTCRCTGPLAWGWRGGSIALAIACFSTAGLAETLEQVWDAAIVASSRFEAAHRLSDSAAESLSASRGGRLPSLTLKSCYTVLNSEPAAKLNLPSLPINQFPLPEDISLSYPALIHLPLYTGGHLDRSTDAARAGIQTQAAANVCVASILKLKIADAYISMLSSRYREGLGTNTEVLDA